MSTAEGDKFVKNRSSEMFKFDCGEEEDEGDDGVEECLTMLQRRERKRICWRAAADIVSCLPPDAGDPGIRVEYRKRIVSGSWRAVSRRGTEDVGASDVLRWVMWESMEISGLDFFNQLRSLMHMSIESSVSYLMPTPPATKTTFRICSTGTTAGGQTKLPPTRMLSSLPRISSRGLHNHAAGGFEGES